MTESVKVNTSFPRTPALRINQPLEVVGRGSETQLQLDASELDEEIFDLLISKLDTVFSYVKPTFITIYRPELKAILRAIIWKFSVSTINSTLGQDILDLKYDGMLNGQWITTAQKRAYAILTICLPWLLERKYTFMRSTESIPYNEKMWWLVEQVYKVWTLAALVNLLVFLVQGKQRLLLERILGIQAVFPKPQTVRQVGFEYLERELLWHGFAEFLFFVLPIINFRKIKNFVSRQLIPLSSETSVSFRSKSEYRECAICGEWPNIPYEYGCKHICCYYCVKSNKMADPAYQCPSCGHDFEESELLPVRIRI